MVTEVPRLRPVEEAAGYFVAAEALTNALKHARATEIVMNVSHYERQLCVAVVDDGVGGARIGAGSGPLNLRDRVSALEGSLTIHGWPDAGTAVTALIPCPLRPDRERAGL